MPRRKAVQLDRADEIREQAKEVASRSGEALKEFAEQTGTAAKDFASRTRDAAKDLVDSIERAAQRSEPKGRRGRKFLGTIVVLGIGTAVIANDKLRQAIGGAVRRRRSEPEPWEPRPIEHGNGAVGEPVSGGTEQT